MDLEKLAEEQRALRLERDELRSKLEVSRDEASELHREVAKRDEKIRWLEAELERVGPANRVDEEWLSTNRAQVVFISRPPRERKVRVKMRGHVELQPTLDQAIAKLRARAGLRAGRLQDPRLGPAKPPAPPAPPAPEPTDPPRTPARKRKKAGKKAPPAPKKPRAPREPGPRPGRLAEPKPPENPVDADD